MYSSENVPLGCILEWSELTSGTSLAECNQKQHYLRDYQQSTL